MRRPSRNKLARLVGLSMLALSCVAAPTSLAQPAGKALERPQVKPPKAQKADQPNTFANILGMVIMAGVVLGASVIPSRRGHQD
jgi:hypothetical protein